MLSRILFLALIVVILSSGCSKKDDLTREIDRFFLESLDIQSDSLLPVDYTCDGEAATLPLNWYGFPEETKSFAILMHHEASPTDIHWYWILYNIPATVSSLPRNVSGIGILGTNSVNDKTEYAPPCSQGPGAKTYIITVYALSEELSFNVSPEEVNMEVFLNAIKDITLASSSLSVVYSRNI
jgi:Raf kinase inhibitor-like YbhB/YbcL family protein